MRRTPLKTFSQGIRRWLPPSSLQFRLTAGITAASVLGLGSLAVWTSWTMQQILVETRLQGVQYVAERFPRDVALYHEMLPIDAAVERAMVQADDSISDRMSDRVSDSMGDRAAALLIWVKRPDRTLLARSQSLFDSSPDFSKMLMSLTEMPLQPQVYPIDHHYLVLHQSPLVLNGVSIGQLYIAEDITEQQETLNAVIHRISLATLLSILLLTLVIAVYIRRSLQPLRQISQLAETISADGLSQAHLALDRAPSEVQELAQMLDAMLSRLSQSWEQQRQFVSNVSHELRTPLSIVYGYLQSLLRRGTSLSPAQREALEIAAAETERTIRLLQELLELARSDNGQIPFRFEWVELNEWATEVIGIGEKFSDRPIQIQSTSGELWVKTDRDRLTQIIVNLIENAVKYSDPQTPILIKLAQTEEHTTIQVCDRGCGIPLQQQTRIFERFYRVDEARTRSTGGVGLGLAIVKSLVEGMGGQVAVWSKLGEGSTFTVTLPTQSPPYDSAHSLSRR